MTETEGEPNTRPISVAELLARNGTIGAPPVGGRRRRRRGRSAAVTVAELTGEIPVIREDAPPPEAAAEPEPEPESVAEPEVVVAEDAAPVEDVEDLDIEVEDRAEEAADDLDAEEAAEDLDEDVDEDLDEGRAEDRAEAAEGPDAVQSAETVIVYAGSQTPEPDDTATVIVEPEPAGEEIPDVDTDEVVDEEAVEVVAAEEAAGETVAVVAAEVAPEEPAAAPVTEAPPRSEIPLPRRWRGPERSHDPRPKRRTSGAEQMSFDPVDQSVDLADLVGEAAQDAEKLRSYLRSPGGALFSGESVTDDLARRGIHADEDEDAEPPALTRTSTPAGGKLAALRNVVIAVLQSVLAVAFGAGLFLGFDQLWRWNTLVALVLSVLVILSLVIAVRVVRKTEDIASTLIAVAVGALVTLGPLALLQSYG